MGERVLEPHGSVARTTWTVLVGAAAGALAGLLVGGVGGRLAMLLLRLTSPDEVAGLVSDDGFVIGVFTVETLNLLAAAAGIGAVGGVAYVVLRRAVPARLRLPIWTALGAAVGGSAIVHEDGVDFTVLRPTALAVALFVALPAAGSLAIALVAERWTGRPAWGSRRSTLLVLAGASLGTVGSVAAVAAGCALLLAVGAIGSGAIERAGRLVVPLALLAVVAVAAISLARETARIL